jgi:hypothetical protein
MKNKFTFYEVVVISSQKNVHKKINGKEGVIMGMAKNEDGEWGYAVDVGDDGWDINEKYLKSTGKILKREDFYDEADRVTVIVDKNGKGEIK